MAHASTLEPLASPHRLTMLEGVDEGVNTCVHCGLCLSYCPTYSELGTEMDSPRGRIFLIASLAEGRIALTDSVVSHLSLCLDCRACESVCPSGVPYGRLIEAAKAEIERQRPGGPLRRLFRWVNFDLLLPRPRLLGLAASALRLYQRSGLQRLVRATGLLRLLPGTLSAWEALLPELPPWGGGTLPEHVPARGAVRARVGFVEGCVQRVVFGAHNQASVRLLARSGAEVRIPREAACCGALHAHAGERQRARALARKMIEVFERASVEAIIVNAAGCGAHMKAYGHLLRDDAVYHARAERFAAKVRDLSEYLAQRPPVGALGRLPLTVTYHDPCHLVHGQKVRVQARQLLQAVPGLQLVELKEADWCCGSAGIYNLTQPEMAGRLLERKVNHLLATGAEAVVTANPGCIIQLALGLRARGSAMKVLHLGEVLDEAYRRGGVGEG
ncbi:MAG: 4Fe-4S dicluster domain-containing protein [Candidatus Rokubacteria bacterium]|nr:4Fe-4S dicluster domain-containing protein [Candidatus Rokubacteria bacterium]